MLTGTNNKDQVLFPKPITFQLLPISKRTFVSNINDVKKVAQECILWGYGENSVVMLRDAAYMNCYQMGIVTIVKTYYSGDYAPLTVKWLNKPEITHHWPDELYLIHEGIPDKELVGIRNVQKEPVYV